MDSSIAPPIEVKPAAVEIGCDLLASFLIAATPTT
jgi:hypothetical protein